MIYKGNVLNINNDFIYRKYNSGIMLYNTYVKDKWFGVPFRKIIDRKLLISFDFDKDLEIIPFCSAEIKFLLNGCEVEPKVIFNSETVKLFYKNGSTYLNGSFYKVQIPTDSNLLNSNIIKNLISLKCLKDDDLEEKDEENLTTKEFSKNSIFYHIDQLSNIHNSSVLNKKLGQFYPFIPNVDLVLCTDMDTEPADFILSSNDKVVFVHVKCGKSSQNPRSPAGAICEVGGQALKNLHWLIHNSPSKYANNTVLRQPWPRVTGSKIKKNHLNTRIRLFEKKISINHNLDDVINTIDERRLNPLVNKEIWIVVGNAFSKSHFIKQFNSTSNALPESIQAYQLLDTWFNQANSNNVDLKIFVSE